MNNARTKAKAKMPKTTLNDARVQNSKAPKLTKIRIVMQGILPYLFLVVLIRVLAALSLGDVSDSIEKVGGFMVPESVYSTFHYVVYTIGFVVGIAVMLHFYKNLERIMWKDVLSFRRFRQKTKDTKGLRWVMIFCNIVGGLIFAFFCYLGICGGAGNGLTHYLWWQTLLPSGTLFILLQIIGTFQMSRFTKAGVGNGIFALLTNFIGTAIAIITFVGFSFGTDFFIDGKITKVAVIFVAFLTVLAVVSVFFNNKQQLVKEED